eukprot:2918157-Alexandrium_andersonii.AAC.1
MQCQVQQSQQHMQHQLQQSGQHGGHPRTQQHRQALNGTMQQSSCSALQQHRQRQLHQPGQQVGHPQTHSQAQNGLSQQHTQKAVAARWCRAVQRWRAAASTEQLGAATSCTDG